MNGNGLMGKRLCLCKARGYCRKTEKAHQIREKRNLVHAKLCLEKNTLINDDTCKEEKEDENIKFRIIEY